MKPEVPWCWQKKPLAIKPPLMRSLVTDQSRRPPGHRPQPAHTGLGIDLTVGQAAPVS